MKGSDGRPRKRTPKPPKSPIPPQLSRQDVTMLMQTIIDKLQVLALRRPRAMIIAATVLDCLLDKSLDLLDDG